MFKSSFFRLRAGILLCCSITLPVFPGSPAIPPSAMDSLKSSDILPGMDSVPIPANAGEAFPDRVPESDREPERDSLLVYLEDLTYNRMLDRAIAYQQRADSLRRLSVECRKEAARVDDPLKRGRFQRQIVQLEDSAGIYNRMANEHFHYLSTSIPEHTAKTPVHPYLIRDTVLHGITVYRYNLTEEFRALLADIREPDAVKGQAPGVQTGLRVLDASPYSSEHPFEREFTLPQGVFYRIQLAVYSKEIAFDHFGGLAPITTESIPGKNMTRYFAGKFGSLSAARTALVKVRSMGYTDAFIIGYYDGRKTGLNKLEALEK